MVGGGKRQMDSIIGQKQGTTTKYTTRTGGGSERASDGGDNAITDPES